MEMTQTKQKTGWLLPAALLTPAALVGLFFLLRGNGAAMDFWVFTVLAPTAQWLGRFWSAVPFSVMECVVAAAVAGTLLWLIRSVVLLVKKGGRGAFLRRLLALGAAWLWVWCALCWMWNATYYASTFSQRSGLNAGPCTLRELTTVTAYFAWQTAQLSDDVPRDEEGRFSLSREEILDRGVSTYENLTSEFPCLAVESVRAKPMIFSRLQSIMGFTGMYFPYTGEANVNVDFPACLLPCTVTHEMAHQRMVASELEANFVGVAACTTCDDVVYQYSGYLSGLMDLSAALWSVSPETWDAIVAAYFTPEMQIDWTDNSSYWAALASPVEEAAEKVYDTYLKSNQQELGIRSYGACVDLLVAYYGAKIM